ncbi:thioesterase domain-containing protein [Pseudoalteromonas sp. SMS1]|uniref:thioesterase II family protein n=1 Tax=Pseudoalteromonas sp. SMS1 TaxID=2908894 RepID=UPI001F461972|nr:thioesterase domain-containing protein [Pseudoalteromonas sp. SMS1]MCF2857599.1 thioesterase domain-containing protein [Pseudoalteromonas sp. SMS1]
MNRERWVVTPEKNNAKVKLICFPYAGGGVPVYFQWKSMLTQNVELNIVQLPGRGTHFAQEPIDDMDSLVEALLPQVSDLLQGDYIIFGHSLGSRVGFELVRQAVARGFPPPIHFFASGSASPKRECFGKVIHNLSDPDFINELKRMNGTPAQVLENNELIQLLLPTLRADMKIAEEYICHEEFTIPTDVTVLSGYDDSINSEDLNSWGAFFRASEVVMHDGDHFFIDSHAKEVVETLNNRIAEYI